MSFGSGNLGDSNSETPTTLPMLGGGLGGGGWWVDDPGALGGALPIGPLSQPTISLVGYAYVLDLTIVGATGDGFGIIETLPGGLERRSFHGDVVLNLNPTMLESGFVEAEVHVPGTFHAAQAAVQWGGVWSTPFTLAGAGVLDVPAGALLLPDHATPTRFVAISPIGEGYDVTISQASAMLVLEQTLTK